jgi:hypothetical protein
MTRKQRIDWRLQDTKRLIRSYREIKIYAGDAILFLQELTDEDKAFFRSLLEEPSGVDVQAIVRSKARSVIMLACIDNMLRTYQVIALSSKRPEEQRRYRVLEYICVTSRC